MSSAQRLSSYLQSIFEDFEIIFGVELFKRWIIQVARVCNGWFGSQAQQEQDDYVEQCYLAEEEQEQWENDDHNDDLHHEDMDNFYDEDYDSYDEQHYEDGYESD